MVRLKRYPVIALSALVASAALLLGIQGAFAQGGPPPIPGTYYGTVSGGPTAGQFVVAFVAVPGGGWVACGSAQLIIDPATTNLVYAIDIAANNPGTHPNCGVAGRTVRFWFPKTAQFANQNGTWQQGLIGQLNLTVGAPMANQNYAPNSANDAAR